MQGLRYYKVLIMIAIINRPLGATSIGTYKLDLRKEKVMKIPHSAPSSDSPNRLHSHGLRAVSLENQSGVLEH